MDLIVINLIKFMSRHLERLIKIDELIRSKNRYTQVSLAEEIEVSERTIRNDLIFLRDRYNAPLKYQKGKGWYYSDPEWRLPSISLSKGELFALTLGAKMLENYAGSAYVNQLSSAIARLSERLPETMWVDLQTIANERILFSKGGTIDLNPDIWQNLELACKKSKSIWMKYFTGSRNSFSQRKFDPYLIHIYRGTNPYVIGFCHKRQKIRWFRIDRIQNLEVLSENFVRDSNFDAKTHLEKIFQSEVGDKTQLVEIWFDRSTAPYISERQWHPSQKLSKHTDGSLSLQFYVSGLNDVKRWVLGYGKGAVVKKPQQLKDMVQEEIKAMITHYSEINKQ